MAARTPDGWKLTLKPPFLRAKHRKFGEIAVNVSEVDGLSAALSLMGHKIYGMQFGFDPTIQTPPGGFDR